MDGTTELLNLVVGTTPECRGDDSFLLDSVFASRGRAFQAFVCPVPGARVGWLVLYKTSGEDAGHAVGVIELTF